MDGIPSPRMADFVVGDIWRTRNGEEWLITGHKPRSIKYPLTGRKRMPNGQTFGKGVYKLPTTMFVEKIGHDEDQLVLRPRISRPDVEELTALLNSTTPRDRQPWQRRVLFALADAQKD